MSEVPKTGYQLEIQSPAEVIRNEQRWRARTAEGDDVVLAQLLPGLASDEALRRRYVYEAERLAATKCTCLAETLAIGPSPDPRDSAQEPPWRLRRQPEGTRLDKWLSERAPLPLDEGIDLLKRLCRVVHQLNVAGLVLRDLEPRSIVLGPSGDLVVTDVGLARIDILSSRTASSLMLESSAYAAPEHLRATVVDARADVYTLGAIAWKALCGVLPYDEGSPFLRDYSSLAKLEDMRSDAPKGLGALLHACLREHPDDRPNSSEELLHILEGNPSEGRNAIERVRCQACGENLRLGLRLCLHCGKTAVQFERETDGPGYNIVLRKAKEDQSFYEKLRRFFEDVGEGPPPELNFLIGDARMYSKAERKARIRLPVVLLRGLSMETTIALVKRLRRDGFDVKSKKAIVASKRLTLGKRLMWSSGIVAGGSIALAIGIGLWPVALVGVLGGGLMLGVGASERSRARRELIAPLLELRAGPVALPASDPFVARIAALLANDLAADVREQVSELALLVQRLCDHRAEVRDETGALAMLTEPLSDLVRLVCEGVESIRSIDAELDDLDEGVLIRAVAASEARGEERASRLHVLDGLDRLRDLEDRRASHMGALLQAGALLERTVGLGLSETDGRLLESNRITSALATLGQH